MVYLLKKFFIWPLIVFISFFKLSYVNALNAVSNPLIADELPGVCVFDVDFTLTCDGAATAVAVCKNAGFALAINTARSRDEAYKLIENNMLLEKGFEPEFIAQALTQQGLNGPFQYSAEWEPGRPKEQDDAEKSFAMRNIANYYNFKLDDIASRKMILFDDSLENHHQMQPSRYEPYSMELCKSDDNGICYNDSSTVPKESSAAFPRNWKIYRGKWIDKVCSRWSDPQNAADDASAMINNVIYNKPRDLD